MAASARAAAAAAEALGEAADTGGARFTFHPLPAQRVHLLDGRERRDRLERWDMSASSAIVTLRFDQRLDRAQMGAFLEDLFNDRRAAEVLHMPAGRGARHPLARPVAGVEWQLVPASLTRMDVFDRLYDAGIARRDGPLAKCIDTPVPGGILASDRLRVALLDEASEDYGLFSPADRAELLVRAFRHLAVGGGLCQYDDSVADLLDSTKAVYRDLVRVHRRDDSGALEVRSLVVQVLGVAGQSLWPRPSPHNFCYVAVDPLHRHATIWYGAFTPLL